MNGEKEKVVMERWEGTVRLEMPSTEHHLRVITPSGKEERD